ncbi:MAG: DUF4411 family protein [Chloroflexaceae bacterium]
MKYSIDTNALINCWRRTYPRDVFPGLWIKLEELVQVGNLIASEEVLRELEKVDDDDTLLQWARTNRQMFVSTDEQIQLAVRTILGAHPGLVNIRKNQSGADPFVIAVAKVNNGAVITDERVSNNPERPKIPDVCRAIGIKSFSVLNFLKGQGWIF